jgi:choice-of-anchor C domain-containing protein
VVSALIVTPVQAVNLIQNGSFETGSIDPGGFTTLGVGSTVITGWTVVGVSPGTIDYIGTFWQASEGSRSLDLDSAGIQQTFGTTIGGTYRVTFDLAGNPGASPTIKNMRVSAGGSSADFSFDITGKSNTNMGWASNSWDFIANSTTTTLEFITLTFSIAGPALDNVSVVALSSPPPSPIPEPSTTLGLLSLGIFGLGSALKRRS